MSIFLRALRRAGFLDVPPAAEQMLIDFKSPQLGVSNILTRSDKDLGGYSSVDLSVVSPSADSSEISTGSSSTLPENQPRQSSDNFAFGRFQGNLSLDLPQDRPEIVRLGYAMFRTKDIEPKLWGLASSEFWNWEYYNHMVLRVRGDRRKYFINVQAESAYPTDLYQHRLFLKSPGNWETVIVPLRNFILTNGGIIQQQQPMNLRQVKSVGIGLIDRQYGPYCLDIDWVKVTANAPQVDSNQQQSPAHLTPGKRLSVHD